ncbi:MAG: hypothetical protein AAF802_09020 [Planctomycetota bacterium]
MKCHNPLEPNVRWPGANLFRNPFGELSRDERSKLACVDIRPIIRFLRNAGRYRRKVAFQLIGECGRGKTTHLLALTEALDDTFYVYLPEDGPCPAIADASLLLIDEAQRLPRSVRAAVLQSGRPLVLATHRDLRFSLRSWGYELETLQIGLSLCPRSLAELLNRRIVASRRSDSDPVPQLTDGDAASLLRQFGTNIREMERNLYDFVQEHVDSHGKMRFEDRTG